MTDDTDHPSRAAIEQFQQLGLTEYGARSYIALLQLGTGTAREISETADVPRTRVYDAIDQLQDEGLVDVQHASPKVFKPVARETALRHFQEKYDDLIEQLMPLLQDLDPVTRNHKQPGVWTVTGSEAITDRLCELIATAETELIYLCAEELLTEEVLEHLAAAAEQGVTIRLAGDAPDIRDHLQTAIPSAHWHETQLQWTDSTAGQLLMVDRETVLVSALTDGGAPTETAIWGSGEHNSLVVVLKATFLRQLSDG